jgi:hypothetical protein
MASTKERQRFIRYWMETTGETEVNLHDVANLAIRMGWDAPAPVTPEERLAKQFKDAARQDIRHDTKTGRPYRGYHAFPKSRPDGQLDFFYVDIDNPKTKPENFRKACVMRREQSVDDLFQLFLDQTHWNESRTPEQKVELLPNDLEFDVQLRLTALDSKKAA